MEELIPVRYENHQPLVWAKDLYNGLDIATRYATWMERIIEYGFIEGKDFFPKVGKSTGGRPSVEHLITVEMAKEICMLQRSEKGKLYRQYFLQLERAWNSPEQVMARALQMANEAVEQLKDQCRYLGVKVAEQKQLIEKIQPKARYLDQILHSQSLVLITQIAKDYGMSAVRMNQILYEIGIQYKRREQWILYAPYQGLGYVHSRTIEIQRRDGRMDVKMQTEWTQKGRLFLYEKLKEVGIIPTIEKEGEDDAGGSG